MSNMSEMDSTYMGIAISYSKLSKARRNKVGACLVTINDVIIAGVNGTVRGSDNNCEDEITDEQGNVKLVTKPCVIHAELNAILKAAREGVSCIGSTIYVTLSPCVPCSAMIAQAGIKRLVYLEEYRDATGLTELQKNKVIVKKHNETLNYIDCSKLPQDSIDKYTKAIYSAKQSGNWKEL